MRLLLYVHFYCVVMYFDDIYYLLIMFGIMHTRKWDPLLIFPNGMGQRAILIVGVQYNEWDPGIVFSPINFNVFGKQAVWEMDSPVNKVILTILVQQKSWWLLSKIFMESQRLKVGKLNGNFKESYRKQVLQNPCLKLLEDNNIGKGGFFLSQIFHWVIIS